MVRRSRMNGFQKLGRLTLFVLLLIIFLELGTYCSSWILRGSPPERAEILSRLVISGEATDPETVAVPNYISNKVLHPFLGFAPDPTNPRVHELGLFGNPPIFERKSDHKVIGIFGGSVALGLCGSPDFLARLQQIFPQRVDLICLAVDGYKQPQQLQALTYFLSLGAVFDIILNLDGFNDIALKPSEPVTNDWFRFFPRDWKLYSVKGFDNQELALISDSLGKRASLNRFAGIAHSFPCRLSFSCLKLQEILYKRAEKQLFQNQGKLWNSVQSRQPEALPDTPPEEILLGLSEVWGRSSELMAQLCQANGIAYYHFLQPNQYLKGSKPLNAAEQQVAIYPKSIYKNSVENGYPLLIQAGKELVRKGVSFHDLSQIFREVQETLYVDSCCHFNNRGYEILSTAILEALSSP